MIAPIVALFGADGDDPDVQAAAMLIGRWLWQDNERFRRGR